MQPGPAGSAITFRTSTGPGSQSTCGCGAGWRRAGSRCWLPTCSRPCASGPRAQGPADGDLSIWIDSRTLQSTPESGARAGYDRSKRRKGSEAHIAVDTPGHLLVLTVTAADQGDHEQVAALTAEVQRSPAPPSSWPMSTRATPDRTPYKRPASTASGINRSSTRSPNAASYCCPAAGSWNTASPGQAAFEGWPETPNDSTRPLTGSSRFRHIAAAGSGGAG